MRFNIFDVFAGFGQKESLSLREPTTAQSFLGQISNSLMESLNSETFIQGLRTEAMFESLVASLGGVEILKQEDEGEVYASDETLKVPDFRMVLADGHQVLVEVKNHYQGKVAMKSFSMTEDYFQELIKYCKLMTCDLKVAVYWVCWNIWTLVSPNCFAQEGRRRVLPFLEAMQANEMSILGDVHIGTKFPLCLRLLADKNKPRSVSTKCEAPFTIGAVELYCAGNTISDPIEQRIALFLMLYGDWPSAQPRIEIVDGLVEFMEYTLRPEEDSGQGFEIIGTLSGMFSVFYRAATADQDKIVQLHLNVEPGLLGCLIPPDHKGGALPLWRLIVKKKS
jgi:hypothetical protein